MNKKVSCTNIDSNNIAIDIITNDEIEHYDDTNPTILQELFCQMKVESH